MFNYIWRRAIEEGIKDIRMKIAMEKYLDEEFSLCRAAEFADVSIQQMAKYLTQKGIPFFKQSIEETMRDVKESEGWLSKADTNRLSSDLYVWACEEIRRF